MVASHVRVDQCQLSQRPVRYNCLSHGAGRPAGVYAWDLRSSIGRGFVIIHHILLLKVPNNDVRRKGSDSWEALTWADQQAASLELLGFDSVCVMNTRGYKPIDHAPCPMAVVARAINALSVR
jgi:hypothetical protein